MKSSVTLTLAEIAEKIGGELIGDAQKEISSVAPFETAGPDQITLASDAKFVKQISDCKAGAVMVPASVKEPGKIASDSDRYLNLLRVENPRYAWARAMQLFYPTNHPRWGIDIASRIGVNVDMGDEVSIGPFVVIADNVTMGDNVTIYPHVYIGSGVVLGDDVTIYPNVTIYDACRIGSRVVIHSGSVIGSDGFGYAPHRGKWEKIPQVGIVVIEDDVEIGALNAIDRATFEATRIGAGVKTDNQVHIAHNVRIGENSVIVAQVGISGSVEVGKNVTLAGQAGVAQHLKIGDGAIVGPSAGLARDVPEKQVVSGAPALPHGQWLRVQNVIPKLPEMSKQVNRMEKRLAELEKLLDSEKSDREHG